MLSHPVEPIRQVLSPFLHRLWGLDLDSPSGGPEKRSPWRGLGLSDRSPLAGARFVAVQPGQIMTTTSFRLNGRASIGQDRGIQHIAVNEACRWAPVQPEPDEQLSILLHKYPAAIAPQVVRS